MKALVTVFVVAFACVSNAFAAQVVVPAGTRVRLKLKEDLSSENSKIGAPVELEAGEEVRIGSQVVIAAGARAQGYVTDVRASAVWGSGRVSFTVSRLFLITGILATIGPVPGGEAGPYEVIESGKAAIIRAGTEVLALTSADIELPVD
jgi:hypothetical protein